MNNVKKLLISLAVLGLASAAQAQSSSQSTGEKSNDPFVQNRAEKKEARKDLKKHKITKGQYKQERKDANAELKASGERPAGTGNIEVPSTGGKSQTSGK